jgi:chromosome partitioning protein
MHIIAVSSFKGGTAKTSTALHLGAAMSKFHKLKVLLVDFDAQANLTSGLGFDADSLDSLASVLQEKTIIEKVIIHTSSKDLDLIPGDVWLERVEVAGNLASDRYSHERLKKILNPMASQYDIIIIDTPPSLCWLTESSLIAANYSLICATPEFYSVKGLQRLSLFIENISSRHKVDVLGVNISFWNSRGKNNKTFSQLIEENFPKKRFKTQIRRDIAIAEAAIYGKPVFDTHPNSRAAKDFKALTKEIVNRLNQKTCKGTKNGKDHLGLTGKA